MVHSVSLSVCLSVCLSFWPGLVWPGFRIKQICCAYVRTYVWSPLVSIALLACQNVKNSVDQVRMTVCRHNQRTLLHSRLRLVFFDQPATRCPIGPIFEPFSLKRFNVGRSVDQNNFVSSYERTYVRMVSRRRLSYKLRSKALCSHMNSSSCSRDWLHGPLSI